MPTPTEEDRPHNRHILRKVIAFAIIVVALAWAFSVGVKAVKADGPDLSPGWNFVAGPGLSPQGYHVEEPCITSIYTQVDGVWYHWFSDWPSWRNGFLGINWMPPEMGFWVYCDPAHGSYSIPAIPGLAAGG